jgi:thiamine biosynthesis lipoprotein
MRKIIAGVLSLIILVLSFTGCQNNKKDQYIKYSGNFFDTFNTITSVVSYAKSEEEFNMYFEKIESSFNELHKLYDIYNNYEGINNLKTINDNAGIKPVKVDRQIIDLILFSKEWNKRTNGKLNIAMGSVLSIWHDYREEGMNDPFKAKVPPMEVLLEAAKHTDIDKVIVNEQNSTVYLEDKKMSLDVGAVAKGYATEVIAKEISVAGLKSGILSPGGNIRTIGKPLDGIRERWGIGIQDPDKPILTNEESNLDVVFIRDSSVVSSGDYERYYVVDDKVLHHLIDPTTLMPGDFYRAVTIVTEDSGIADALSTAVFLLPYEQSRALVESISGVDVLWVMKDGEIKTTEGMKKILKSKGASAAKAK